MAITSLTKQFILKDDEAADRLIKIINDVDKVRNKENFKSVECKSSLEKGRELFRKVFEEKSKE